MSQDTQQEHISKRKVLYTMPGMDAVTVRRDVTYRATEADALTMDLYYPPDSKHGARACAYRRHRVFRCRRADPTRM